MGYSKNCSNFNISVYIFHSENTLKVDELLFFFSNIKKKIHALLRIIAAGDSFNKTIKLFKKKKNVFNYMLIQII